MTIAPHTNRQRSLAITLILTGAIGWAASFALTLDKFAILTNPQADLSCNISVLVQCATNLNSWQGQVFGFPNPLLGLGGFVAPIAVGVAVLAQARFARWFWIAFATGVTGALGFCVWLISQSIFVLATLCPWCMAVWGATIIMFWALLFDAARAGVFGSRPVRIASILYRWVPAITLGSYLVIAIIAQLRLDLLSSF